MKRKKRTPRKILIDKLDTLAKTCAKVRDGYACQKCGLKVEGVNAHGSHVVPVSHGNNLRWDLLNIKCMCYHHHQWWHLNPLESGIWFKEKFPARDLYLSEKKHIIKKFSMADLEELHEKLTEKLEELTQDSW